MHGSRVVRLRRLDRFASDPLPGSLLTPTPRLRCFLPLSELASALVAALAAVDPYTRRHSIRVAAYAERLARGLKLPAGEVETIRLAGLLHDVGKVAQERALLQKPGPLDGDERRRIEAHPIAGAEILGQVPALERVAAMVRHHHERPDGGGYPARLRDEAIPLGSRVVLVADAFDAMTSDRPYRPGMSEERAVAEITRCAGAQFDSRVAATLEDLRGRGRFELIVDDPSLCSDNWAISDPLVHDPVFDR